MQFAVNSSRVSSSFERDVGERVPHEITQTEGVIDGKPLKALLRAIVVGPLLPYR